MVDKENKSGENAIKTGNIAENIDIYPLLWQKMFIFASILLLIWCDSSRSNELIKE